MKKIIVSLFLVSAISSFSQSNPVDSLTAVLKQATDDTVKIRLLQHLAEIDTEENLQKHVDASGPLIEKQLELLSKNSKEYNSVLRFKAANLENSGLVFQNKGNITKSLDMHLEALKIREAIRDSMGIGSSLNNIGLLYSVLEDHEKAAGFYIKSYEVCEKCGNQKMAAYSLNGIGDVYIEQKKFKEALGAYFKSLSIKKAMNDKFGMGYSFNNIGVVYKKMGMLDSAIVYFKKSLQTRKEIDDKNGIAYSYINISRTYIQKKDVRNAEESGLEALQLSKEINFPNTIRYAADVLQAVYEQQNNYKKAYEMVLISKTMSEIIVNDDTKKELLKKELEYDFEKKNIADSLAQKAEKELNTLKFEQEKNQRYYLYIGLGLAIIFSVFIFNRFRISQKQNKIIEEQKLVVEKQKDMVEQKQREILASIHYAKRIQTSLLPNENYLKKHIPKS